ncbi:RNA polymerase sigma-70 factor, ECF subfamily [Microbulbifer donghaiensis]|uniref:RNA polymerase sigma-70 factor, ECF subfamily n=2 Tax=Microbulbifer donghaiensis TaxID=494016 RepID=A0A1M5EBG0_9GAMM|nr:RNA polymerase sigma-70 factor, ECF subfamily [Microbulbifer donghaiensis]
MDSVDAEDLVQDVLTGLVPRLADLEAVEQLGPWLIKVLYRRYVDLYRRRRTSPLEQSACSDCDSLYDESGTDHCEQLNLRRALNQALLTLDDDRRDVVLLHDVEGYTAIEVAEILGISVGTVKSRLHRARQRLKKVLAPGTIEAGQAC